MEMFKNLIWEVLEIQRGSILVEDMEETTAILLLLGYCSLNDLSSKLDLELILNSGDIKSAVRDALVALSELVPTFKNAIDKTKVDKLAGEEIAKILVIFKTTLKNTQQYVQAFECMLEYMADMLSKSQAEYITAKCVNELAVQLVDAKAGTFYDGTFGVGGSAIEAYRQSESNGKRIQVYGQEINQKAYRLACIRLFINGINPEGLKQESLLQTPLVDRNSKTMMKFDYIIMQPPFGVQWKEQEKHILKDDHARFIYGTPSMSSADWLFISAALKALNEKGKAAIITTLGALFRTGPEENLRKKLLGFDYIEAIIELPAGLFNNTGIPCAIIIFNMNKEEKMKHKIQFINADTLYENVRRGKKILTPEHIKYIVDIYNGKEEVAEISTVVNLQEIENVNLSPSRYVIKTVFESTLCGKVNIHLDKLKANKTLGQIGNFYRGINVTSKNVQDPQGNYKIINLADVKNGVVDIEALPTYKIDNNARVEAYKVEAGDIIISNKGPTKICIIPEHTENVLISQNFIGIRVNALYSADYIKAFLESPVGEYLIDSRKTGTAVAMINLKDLKEIPLVADTFEHQQEMMAKYAEEEEALQKQLEELYHKKDALTMTLYDKMGIKTVFER